MGEKLAWAVINGSLGFFLFGGICCTASGVRHVDLNRLTVGFVIIVAFAIFYGPIQRIFK